MEKIKDALIGFAIGDALGVPFEFTDRKRLFDINITNMLGNMSHNVKKGTWSDDTSMVLATMDSIINNKGIDYNDIMDNFFSWVNEGKYTPDNKAFGVGKITLQALGNYRRGVEPLKCGLDTIHSNGNGSLMRILPIAFYSFYKNLDEQETYNLVKDISSLTHRHEISILGCYIYTLFVIELLKGNNKEYSYQNIKRINYSMFKSETLKHYERILKNDISLLEEKDIKSYAYVVDTLEATLWLFLTTDSYDSSVVKAIRLGNDTDTIAALVGALSGIYYGHDSINEDWIKDLRLLDYLKKVSKRFYEI